MFLALFALLCELKPLSGNKMITEAHHFDLEMLKGFLDSVNEVNKWKSSERSVRL
ncbi:MAG: hypothetical protein QW304_08315 [Thermoproteota archaeon]